MSKKLSTSVNEEIKGEENKNVLPCGNNGEFGSLRAVRIKKKIQTTLTPINPEKKQHRSMRERQKNRHDRNKSKVNKYPIKRRLTGMVNSLQRLDLGEKEPLKIMDEPGGYKIPLMAENVTISTAKDVIDGLSDEYRNEKRECFGAVMLSTKNRVLDDEVISIGTLNSSLVHPREIFKPAIKISACSVILIHNHPSGDPKPSNEDIELSMRIEKAGKILGIEVLDFLIYGTEGYTSFKETGLF